MEALRDYRHFLASVHLQLGITREKNVLPQKNFFKHIALTINLVKSVFSTTCITAIFCCCVTLFALEPPQASLKFDRLSLEDGISHNLVYAMLQDRSGFLWFGTMYGLVRYDGTRYRVFRHDPTDPHSISYDDIIALFEDSRGKIWAGTWGGGLNRFDPITETFLRYTPEESGPTATPLAMIWSITETAENGQRCLWLAADRNGLVQFFPDSDSLKLRVHRPDSANANSISGGYVRKVYRDRSGAVWVGSNRGISVIDSPEAGSITFKNVTDFSTEKGGNVSNFVTEIMEDRLGNIWIGTPSGIHVSALDDRASGRFSRHFTHSPDNPHSITGNYINFIHEDKSGTIWVGTGNGLSYLTPQHRINGYFLNETHDPANPFGLPGNNVLTALEDQSGVLWFGIYQSDLCKIVPGQQQFLQYSQLPGNEQTLSGAAATAVLCDNSGNIWVGTNNGLNRITPTPNTDFQKSQLPVSIPGDPVEQLDVPGFSEKFGISALAERRANKQQQLWIGSAGNGLFVWDISQKQPRQIQHFQSDRNNPNSIGSNYVNAILVDTISSQPAIWVGTGNGLSRMELSNFSQNNWQHFRADGDSGSLPHPTVLTIFQSPDGNIWVGSYGGLSKFLPESGTFRNYRHRLNDPQSISNNYVYAIYAVENDGQQSLWVGTSNGLNLFDPKTGIFKTVDERHGLPNGVICGILADDAANLWVSTQKGLSRLNPETLEIRNFSLEDGLQSNIFSPGVFAKTAAGEMLFGGINGLNRFDPQHIDNDELTFSVMIVNVSINQQPIGQLRLQEIRSNRVLEMAYEDHSLQLDVAVPDYRLPQKNQVRYRLNEQENGWQIADANRQISFPLLPPGEYVLQLNAANPAGKWHPKIQELRITVAPPYWQTTWFYGLVFVLISLIAGLFHHWRVRQKVRQAEVIAAVREAERYHVREQTARDYHDQLGHQVAKITLFGELIRRELSAPRPFAMSQSANSADVADLPERQSRHLLRYLQKITDSATRLGTDTRDFIWSLNPEKDTLYDVAIHLRQFAESLFEDTDVRLSVNGIAQDLEHLQLPMDERRNLVLLFKEALTNALKHANCDEVLLSFGITESGYEIRLADDGAGMATVDFQRGNGFSNMKKRAELIGGILKIFSQPGQGLVLALNQHNHPLPDDGATESQRRNS
ncbi:MAG: two-component regulator propeller domain-containing protein [Calditrichia bacterium]